MNHPKKLLSTQNPKSLAGSWFFTVLWCGVSFPVFYIFGFKERDLMGGAIGGLFTLIGIAMLYASIKLTLEYWKYGEVHLTLEGAVPATGQSFGAKVNLPANAAAAGRISAELACVRVTWTRGSKSVSKREQDAWTKQQVFPARRSALGDYAALKIEIPSDKPPSDVPEELAPDSVAEAGHPAGIELDRDYYRWELRIKADVPGIDFERTFYLRVGPGAQTASRLLARPSPVMTDPELHERLITRRAAMRSIATACVFVALTPIVLPIAIAGVAIGLAGCPMAWSLSNPPACVLGGIDLGPVMARGLDLMFTMFPYGIGASVVLGIAAQAWVARDESAASTLRSAAPWIGTLAVAGFLGFLVWAPRKLPPVAAAQPAVTGSYPATAGSQAARSGTTGGWQHQENLEEQLKNTLVSTERSGGGPAAALAHYRHSLEYERQKRTGEQEQALLRALAILEKYSDAEVKTELGASGSGLDKEVVARRLADIYWDLRRYDSAYAHYDRAYRYAREVQASDSSLNLKLARNSAGRMATACMLGNWDVADSAMAELKERIGRVNAAEQKRLDYWIRTGEPRLAARKC
jgi:hypothetical protein